MSCQKRRETSMKCHLLDEITCNYSADCQWKLNSQSTDFILSFIEDALYNTETNTVKADTTDSKIYDDSHLVRCYDHPQNASTGLNLTQAVFIKTGTSELRHLADVRVRNSWIGGAENIESIPKIQCQGYFALGEDYLYFRKSNEAYGNKRLKKKDACSIVRGKIADPFIIKGNHHTGNRRRLLDYPSCTNKYEHKKWRAIPWELRAACNMESEMCGDAKIREVVKDENDEFSWSKMHGRPDDAVMEAATTPTTAVCYPSLNSTDKDLAYGQGFKTYDEFDMHRTSRLLPKSSKRDGMWPRYLDEMDSHDNFAKSFTKMYFHDHYPEITDRDEWWDSDGYLNNLAPLAFWDLCYYEDDVEEKCKEMYGNKENIKMCKTLYLHKRMAENQYIDWEELVTAEKDGEFLINKDIKWVDAYELMQILRDSGDNKRKIDADKLELCMTDLKLTVDAIAWSHRYDIEQWEDPEVCNQKAVEEGRIEPKDQYCQKLHDRLRLGDRSTECKENNFYNNEGDCKVYKNQPPEWTKDKHFLMPQEFCEKIGDDKKKYCSGYLESEVHGDTRLSLMKKIDFTLFGKMVSDEDGGEISENIMTDVDCNKILSGLRRNTGPTLEDVTSAFTISKHFHAPNPKFKKYIAKRRKLMYDQHIKNGNVGTQTIVSGALGTSSYEETLPIAHGGKSYGLPVVPNECQNKWGDREEGREIVKYSKEQLFEDEAYFDGSAGYENTFSTFKRRIENNCDIIMSNEMSSGEALNEITKNTHNLINSGRSRQMGTGLGLQCSDESDCVKKEVSRYLQKCHIHFLEGAYDIGTDPNFADIMQDCKENLIEYFSTGEPSYAGVPEKAPVIYESLLNGAQSELVSMQNYYTCAGKDVSLRENCHREYLGLEAVDTGAIQSQPDTGTFDDKDDGIKGAMEGLEEDSRGVGDADDDENLKEKQEVVIALGAFIIGLAVVYSL